MSKVSSEQVQCFTGGNYSTLEDFLNRKIIIKTQYNYTTTVSNANIKLLDNSIVSGYIAKNTTSTGVNGHIVAAGLSGVVGAGAITTTVDGTGNIANLVEIRKSDTNDPILDTDGKRVYGLIQCSNTVSASGSDQVGASGSENLQISFVKFDDSDTLTLVQINQTIEFVINKMYAQKYYPTVQIEGTVPDIEILNGSVFTERKFLVTTEVTLAETITISTATCSGTGVLTGSKDNTLRLPGSSSDFVSNGAVQIYRNGQKLDKGTGLDVEWVSNNSFKINYILRVGEIIEIIAPTAYI